ncbi:hypothetical protein [Methanocella conradii]|uniref:hypothetical protein n=1 Tax=Methanocella conradii TaxID=1175444 RepID=UPI0024B373DA|nr:hypothetical protein [Methanocella conradii]MDI6895927.1 hypothetical protein [Methanocella conradii]
MAERNEQEVRLEKAAEDYKKMMKEISPFIIPRKIVQLTSEGEWCETSICLNLR